jgi:hypothetical protein
MGATDWPTWWVLVAPAMMFAFMAVCMASMRRMMRGPYMGHDEDRADRSGAADSAPTGPHVPARFPDRQAAFEGLGTAQEKAEFDKFLTEQRARPDPPP